MKKRVYFVGGGYMGCYYLRCFLPLLENGWSGNYMSLKKTLKPTHIVEQQMMNADIIVFHRADTEEHHKLAKMLKDRGKKIVFDNDDTMLIDETHAFFGLDEKGFKENVGKKNELINSFVKNADLVTASTDFLAEEYRQLNPNVIVLPNCVNQEDWDTPKRNKGKKVRIGVVGSVAYSHDFDEVRDVLKALDEDERVQLVMFGLQSQESRKTNPLVDKVHVKEYEFWDSLTNLEHAPWREMTDYFDTLNDLEVDIMLIPRKESYFNKAKSNVKFLEAAMCEIPVIASSFPDAPYEKDINGNNGILIKKTDDWMEAINKLISDKKLRRQIGKEAKKYVLKNYNITKRGSLWVEAYENL